MDSEYERSSRRLRPVDAQRLDQAQAEVRDRIVLGPRGELRGPFTVLLHSAGTADALERLGSFLRFECTIPPRLRELTILTVAAHWGAEYEWSVHARIARNLGVPPEVLGAIREGQSLPTKDSAEVAVHAYSRQILHTGRADPVAFDACHVLLGDAGIVELTAIIGYYTTLAFAINTFAIPEPR